MRVSTRLAFASAMLLTLAPLPGEGTDAADPDWGSLSAVAQKEIEGSRTPGAAVAVVHDGRLVFAEGVGTASVEAGGKPDADTVFRLGSTTKMLVAAALLTLADARAQPLDAPIARIAPELDASIGRLTIHQILSHTAGIAEMPHPPARLDESALAEHVRTWKAGHFFTEPGDIYSYASSGYWLAGYLVERLADKPFADAMRETLFEPLGMARTTFRPTWAMTFPLSQGHEGAPGGAAPVVVRPFVENVPTWPGGSVFSTAHDMARFAAAFVNGGQREGKQALSRGVVERMSAAQAAMPGGDAAYTYGLVRYDERGVTVLEHGGARRGFGSVVRLIPSRRFAVVALANRSGINLRQTINRAGELAAPGRAEAPDETAARERPIDAATAGALAGRYVNGDTEWIIEAGSGRPQLRRGENAAPLLRVADEEYAVGALDGERILVTTGASRSSRYIHTGLAALRKIDD